MANVAIRKLSPLWRYLLVGGAAVALLAALSAARGADEEAGPAPAPALVAAVVDMSQVRRGSQQWQDAQEERTRLLQTMKRTTDKLKQQWQVLRTELENQPPGTEERRRKARLVEQALQELQRTQLEFERRLVQHYNQSIRDLFGDLSRVVGDYAREHGITLVLKKQGFEATGPQTAQQSLQMATTEVLYADAALDISEPIIERLNAEYPGPIEVK